MNIRLKAGLEVVAFFVVAVVAGIVATLGLNYLTSVYGERAVVHGVALAAMLGFFYFVGGILYDIRLSQLRYKEKLLEMTNK